MNDRDSPRKTPADYGLITVDELSRLWQVTPARARQILSRNGIHAVIGYDRDAALRSDVRPGRGARTDLKSQKEN